MMKCLIDGDLIAYRAAFAAQKTVYNVRECTDIGVFTLLSGVTKCAAELYALGFKNNEVFKSIIPGPKYIALNYCDIIIQSILTSIYPERERKDYVIYLHGKDNFRKRVSKEYKANRKNVEPPYWLDYLYNYMEQQYYAELVDYMEVDDRLSIDQLKSDEETIICSIDKDMLQVPGKHYNFVTKEFTTITEQQGIRNLYAQMLTGDVADNIKGIVGVGAKKANKILDAVETIYMEKASCFYAENILLQYTNSYGGKEGADKFNENLKLLSLLKTEEEERDIINLYYEG